MTASVDESLRDNPLLNDFDFPPFDCIQADHVRPGIRPLLKKLEGELAELESTVEPSWPKLVEPLEKIIDRLAVIWGAVNHLKAVKDTPELRSAIEEVQHEKVKFELKLRQSKPIYNAFKAIKESPDWAALSDARKRIVECKYLTILLEVEIKSLETKGPRFSIYYLRRRKLGMPVTARNAISLNGDVSYKIKG